MSSKKDPNLDSLPKDCIFEICQFLPGKDLARVRTVNKTFNQMSQDNYIWKNVCDKEWKETAPMTLLRQPYVSINQGDFEDPQTLDWKDQFRVRQQSYNTWKHNLDVRFWLPTDYLLLLWWLFIDPKSQPEYLPLDEANQVKENATRAGISFCNICVFLPLILISMVDHYWFLIGYFSAMFVVGIVFDKMDVGTLSGKVILFLHGVLLIVVSFLNTSNDIFMIVFMMMSLSIALALARSMKAIILDDVRQIDLVEMNHYPTIILTVSTVLVGACIGIAGIKAVLFVLIIFLISVGVKTNLHAWYLQDFVGVKGMVMLGMTCISVLLYVMSIFSVGKKQSRTLSACLLALLFGLNISLVVRYIMLQFGGYPVIALLE
jgi:hypothetical protein